MAASIEEFVDRIRTAAATPSPLQFRGGGSKSFYGRSQVGEILDTRLYRGIVEYEPAELYVTARCGTPLAELQNVLACHRQMLAFEPPHFGASTVGGAIAAGLSGPRRASHGPVRDFVLGVRVIDGRAQDLSFGGQVMKNVAGYDVSRLIAGSLGTLALIAEVSLKVLPMPAASVSVAFDLSEDEATTKMNQLAGMPLPISATCHVDGRLYIRLSGSNTAVKAARTRIGGEAVSEDETLWQSIREQTHLFFAGPGDLWRLSMPPTTPPLGLGRTLVEWGGAQRWLRSRPDPRVLHAAMDGARGHATLFRTDAARNDVFAPLSPVLAKLHQRLKQAFDPQRIFNPGRMYPEL